MAKSILKNIKKILVLGSGGLKIGQAGEFDYSGSQAIKAISEEGIKTVLVNPNIATIQTSEGMADKIYFLPVTPYFVEEVIKKEQPDSIMLAFGGQTALNCGVLLQETGVLDKYDVKVLGTSISVIQNTEDRELFVEKLNKISAKVPRSIATKDLQQAANAAKTIGYPVMVRVAYALGGSGSGLCKDEKQLIGRCKEGFSTSPQILVEEWLGGWKEVEYEIVRDSYNNCITVCNMENFDPLGIHTGESIVVAPSQTLTNTEYHKLRKISLKVIRHLGVVGECNIQFALNPHNGNYRIIEVNARLSRSSALASKATGYPLAFIAAKIAMGYSLTELENKVTKRTMACFEPALDYVVVKMPRWDLKKFKTVDKRIGSEMKSVGEVMAIGRKFEEALQKALRMVATGMNGLTLNDIESVNIIEELKHPTDVRVFAIGDALKHDWTIEEIYKHTKIDKWFLYKLKNIIDCEEQLSATQEINKELLQNAKQLGFSDNQLAIILNSNEQQIRNLRKQHKVQPFVKQIDTLSAEYPAVSNYLYLTYNASSHDIAPCENSVIILGSGSYRIGSSVEFDWCCVNALIATAKRGFNTIMINYNPETVSTDYDICDRLYFDELSYERVMDINEFENPYGIIISMGGQIPNSLAMPLNNSGVNILGTSPENIDRAEDRYKFSRLLDDLGVDQPQWKELTSIEDAEKFAKDVGYPVLIRPSYVLSGAAMNVVWNCSGLDKFLKEAIAVNPEHPVVITKFIENSKEIEIDAVAKDGEIIIYAMTEHVENAGVHSGDATVLLPAQRLYVETIRRVKRITRKIAVGLNITGPFNIQFLAYHNKIKVIECNLRASRSFPFCSKIFKKNMIEIATNAILGEKIKPIEKSVFDLDYVGVKAAQFSFPRLKGADPVLGVEMASTGEVACIGSEIDDAFLKAMVSSGQYIPKKTVLLSTGPIEDKAQFIESAIKLQDMGYSLYGSLGTAKFLKRNKISIIPLYMPLTRREPNILDYLKDKKFDLVLNIPKNNQQTELKNDYLIRRTAVDFEIPLITNIKVAIQFVSALEHYKKYGLEIKSWDEY